MMIFRSFRSLLHFWEFGGGMAFLIPVVLVLALAIQVVIFRSQKRPWLPAVVTGGLMVLTDVTVSLIILKLERAALGAAFFGLAVEMMLLAIIIGLVLGLLIGCLPRKEKAA